jgi:hypothetical protein
MESPNPAFPIFAKMIKLMAIAASPMVAHHSQGIDIINNVDLLFFLIIIGVLGKRHVHWKKSSCLQVPGNNAKWLRRNLKSMNCHKDARE